MVMTLRQGNDPSNGKFQSHQDQERLNHLLSNIEYVVINVLKALALIIVMCDLHVIFLSSITPRYFTLFTNG
jgi:hypothetical protein